MARKREEPPRKTRIMLICVRNPIRICKATEPVLLSGKVTIILEFIFMRASLSQFTHAHTYQLKK
jgi:hypothetical protein